MNATTKQAPATIEELTKQLEALRTDFVRLSSTAAQGAADQLDYAGQRIAQTSREAKTSVEAAVTENPLAAIGIAAGVGYLLGILSRR